jgi:hypothetical protein
MFKKKRVFGLIVSASIIFLITPANCFAGCITDPVISGVVRSCADNSTISDVTVTYVDGSVSTNYNGSYTEKNDCCLTLH